MQGTQRLFELGGSITQPNVGFANYSLNWLSYGASYQGQKHNFQGEGARGKWRLWSLASQLSSSSLLKKTAFFRTNQHLQLDLNKAWIGAKFQSENNQERDSTQTLTGLSQRFVHYEFVAGLGDSTAVFT